MAAIADLIDGVTKGVTGLFDTGYNVWNDWKTRQREDNAVQRRVADLQKAGINPLYAVDSAAAASAGNSIHTDTGNFMQSVYDLKERRESYKQQQLITRMLERQDFQSFLDSEKARLDYYALFGTLPQSVTEYGRFGDIRSSNYYNSDHSGIDVNVAVGSKFPGSHYYVTYNDTLNKYAEQYVQSLRNNYSSAFNQSLYTLKQSDYSLKNQSFENVLHLINSTLAPVLDLADLVPDFKRAFAPPEYRYRTRHY